MTRNYDPELLPYLEHIPVATPGDLNATRAFVDQLVAQARASADTTGLVIEDRVIPGPVDHPELAVRVYAQEDRRRAVPAGILHIHGGGFMVGSIDMEHAGNATLARELGVTVVSVEYRLAPEHPFPAAINDCYAALTWFHEQATAFDVDPARIAIAGSSAGGGLAAGLALLARDRSGPPICFQYLGIPELDDRLETPSMVEFVDTPMWSRPQGERSWQSYLGDAYGTADVSPYASPARATDLSGLPPAFVSTMENDPLRDEGIIYAMRLLQAGVSTELHSYPGTFHGSGAFPVTVTRRIADEILVVLRRALVTEG
jgi:acetyl esterase/lipase